MGRRPWFGRKRAGFGYHPQTLQGWTVLGVLTVFLVLAGKLSGPGSAAFAAAIAAMVIVPILIIIYQRSWLSRGS
jgi:hypothetical protein